MDAIFNGDDDRVEKLLQQGGSATQCNLNCEDYGFHHALVSGDFESNLVMVDVDHQSALQWAIF